jgi:hypothetical protein
MHSGYVFNIGFNKCGTTSLSAALNRLGVATLHHQFTMTVAGEPPRIVRLCDLWRANQQQGRRPFFGLDGQVRGYTDFMGERCFRLLDEAYPGSKFILTVRPLEDWLTSREKHVERNLRRPDYSGGFVKVDRPGWTAEYWSHIEDTGRFFAGRPNDFLVMDIPSGHGWDPLCRLLEAAVPEQPFPWGNKT